MRLISLEISNFRVIRNVRLTFPDSVIGIIGPNGAGKSSIIEAVSWALYGNQAARTGKDEIKSSFARADDNCEVRLEFSVNEERYRVARRLVGRTERAEVELYRGEASESVGVNETKAYVGQLLGLDWRGFLSSFLARQAELNALSDLQPSKRRDHIAGMLGIERLDKAIQRVKEDSRLYKDKGQFLERQIAQKDQVLNRLEQLREALSDFEEPLAELKREQEKAESQHKAAKDELASVQKKRDEWLRLQARIQVQRTTLEALVQQQKALSDEQEKLTQHERDLENLGRQLSELTPAREEFEKQKEAKSKIAMKEELTERQKSTEAQVAQEKTDLEALERKLGEIDAALSKYPENIEERFRNEQQRLESARDEYSRLRAELESGRKQAAKLQEQLKSVDKLGPDSVCERCRRPFGEDFQQIRNHLAAEVAQLLRDLSKAEQGMLQQKKAGEKLRDLVDQLEREKNLRYQSTLDRQSTVREMDSLRRRLEANQNILEQIGDQLTGYKELYYDPVRFREAAEKFERMEKMKERHDQLTGSLARLPIVRESIAEVGRKLEETRKNEARLTEEATGLGYNEDTFRELSVAFEQSRKILDSASNEYLTRSKEKELTEKELEGKLEQLKSFEEAELELEESRSAHYYGEKLGRLFGDFRQELIASIRPSLADISSGLMAEMSGGKYNLVELDEKYNLRVMDSGVYYGVDRFSGGEKDLANLCLRLAISLALTESAGLTRSFVILDEVFGSQDNQRKELILQAMAQLKNRFPQILLVTHVDDVKDGVEEIVEVVPTGSGWSEVRVNGVNV
ncbi:MAG: SMC family ATPase [Candidatus Zixiibacteriota bacterium]|nr:MAG: SMC family ATPase [candidate division Zixibacteria bacterium]